MAEPAFQQKGKASHSMYAYICFQRLSFVFYVFIDYPDDFDDAPVSSSTRGGGGGAAFQNSGPSGDGGGGGLYPCSVCNRRFASDRIEKHEAACVKANKQRRVFDTTKHRLEGTEAAAYFGKGKGGKGRNEPAKPQVKVTSYNQFNSKVVFLLYFIRFLSRIGDRNMKILFELFVMLNKQQTMRKEV